MKYLSDYIDEGTKGLNDKHKVFFAFNEEQFSEGVNKYNLNCDDVKGGGSGIYGLPEGLQGYYKDFSDAHDKAVTQDIKDNGLDAIIQRELMNYEAHLSYDLINVKTALGWYKITDEHFNKQYDIFIQHCLDNGLF